MADMPSLDTPAAVAADSDILSVEDDHESPATSTRVRKMNGVYVEVVNGEVTGQALTEDEKAIKMKWGEGTVRTFNRSSPLDGGPHPGKAYAESITVFDIDYPQKQKLKQALVEFYAT
jgi:hypothetical protein